MKITLKNITLMTLLALAVSSCLKDKEVSTSPWCAITSFTVGNITTYFTTKTADGLNDSVYSRVIDGGTIHFNIDQKNGVIESVDSIVNWANISRVVPTVTYQGYIYCKQRGSDTYFSFSSGTDSVDFTQDVEFLMVSTDEVNTRIYKAKLNKAVLVSDSLYWKDCSSTGLTLAGLHRTVVMGNDIYVFAEGGGTPTVTSLATTDKTATWTAPQNLTGSDGVIDYRSVTVFKGQFYALNDAGKLYCSDATSGGSVWTEATMTDATLDRLLCADDNYLYAFDGTSIVQSPDWSRNGTDHIDQLPVSPVASAAYTSRTNTKLQHVVMLGLPATVDTYANVWYKISSADKDQNQAWDYVPVLSDNDYGLPAMQNMTMLYFSGQLLAFGGALATDGETKDAFRYIYASRDNGLTWHPYTSSVMLPKELNEAPALAVSAAVVGEELWLIQSGGRVWCGKIGQNN